MAEQSILIIGAGIAGLSAGCYGQMNGYRTRILEMNNLPGGLCTAWQRKGYTFDGCIHWLVGTNPKSSINRVWKELGATMERGVVEHEEFMRIEGPDGKTLILYTNIDRLEEHLLALSPADAGLIRPMTAAMRRIAGLDIPLGEPEKSLKSLIQLVGALPVLGLIRKWSAVTTREYFSRFQDPFLRETLQSAFDMDDYPMTVMMMPLAYMHQRNAGYPIGGSLEFSKSIERRYLSLGGEITYKARVDHILVEADSGGTARAMGVRLSDGVEIFADVVVSAADGYATIFNMLEGKFINDTIRGYYRDLPIFRPVVQISLGVKRDFRGTPSLANFILEKPVTIAGETRQTIGFRHLSFDPGMAPAGKSVLISTINSDYDYWKKLAEDRERYEAEKQQAAITVINELDQHFPGLKDDIEVVDIATPLTTERYTGNWRGSIEGWMVNTRTMGMMMGTERGMKKTLPGLDNFYMVGQWVEPGGGIPPSAASGRSLIQRLCKKDGKKFVVSI